METSAFNHFICLKEWLPAQHKQSQEKFRTRLMQEGARRRHWSQGPSFDTNDWLFPSCEMRLTSSQLKLKTGGGGRGTVKWLHFISITFSQCKLLIEKEMFGIFRSVLPRVQVSALSAAFHSFALFQWGSRSATKHTDLPLKPPLTSAVT